jgi:hypothetical protein
MNEGLSVGDAVTFCKEPEGLRHNALVFECGDNATVALIHVVTVFERSLPQMELNVPWGEPDENGRYYIVEAKLNASKA